MSFGDSQHPARNTPPVGASMGFSLAALIARYIPETRPNEYLEGGSWGSGGFKGLGLGDMELCCLSFSDESSVRSRGATRGGGEPVRAVRNMGLGRGGSIEQKIYPDPHGIEVWKETPTAVEMIYLVSSEDFKQVTGHEAPPTPVTYEKYQQMGLPWFGIHDGKLGDTKGSCIFDKLKPVGEGKAKEEE